MPYIAVWQHPTLKRQSSEDCLKLYRTFFS